MQEILPDKLFETMGFTLLVVKPSNSKNGIEDSSGLKVAAHFWRSYQRASPIARHA